MKTSTFDIFIYCLFTHLFYIAFSIVIALAVKHLGIVDAHILRIAFTVYLIKLFAMFKISLKVADE